MWQQNYLAVGESLWASAAVAATPIVLLFFLIGVRRWPAWKAVLAALAVATFVAKFVFGAPATILAASFFYGVAFGLFPVFWIVLPAIFLYRITVETGNFEIIKDSISHLTRDARVHVLLIAFAFGAFLEGAAGFGAPVAISGAMLAGLGVDRFKASGLCLMANTAPVAFGSIGIPIITLAGLTEPELNLQQLSAGIGCIAPILSLIIPLYLIVLFAGWRKTWAVMPAIVATSVTFAGVQAAVGIFVGPYLADILASLTTMATLVVLLQFWQPRDGDCQCDPAVTGAHRGTAILRAWSPYMLLVVCVLLWGSAPVKAQLDKATVSFGVPWLHHQVQQVAPVVKSAASMPALFKLNWLSAAGTASMAAAILGGFVLGLGPRAQLRMLQVTLRQLFIPALTITSMLGFAYLMNYTGLVATLGLALAATGWWFPFFSALLGWLGVFVTGSDTSANALFGNLQVITAKTLGLNPLLTAATNASAGGVGKMISLQSIAVVTAATEMPPEQESTLFRWALRHTIVLVLIMGGIAMLYAHVVPEVMQWAGKM